MVLIISGEWGRVGFNIYADEMAHSTVTEVLLERKDLVQNCQIHISLSVGMILCPMPLSVLFQGCLASIHVASIRWNCGVGVGAIRGIIHGL